MLRAEKNTNHQPRTFIMDKSVNLPEEQIFFQSSPQGTPVIGIDLGSRKIRAVAGFINNQRKVDVLGMAETESAGITRGLITNADETANAISTVVDDVSLLSGAQVKEVFVSIPGSYTKRFTYTNSSARKNADKPVSKEELFELYDEMRDLELQQGDEVIHFFPQKFLIDGKTVEEPVGKQGKKLEVEMQVVTGNSEVARLIHQCLQKAGLQVASLIPGYVASASANLSDNEKREGVALLDMGASATHVAVFRNGMLRYSAVIPFGSGSITEDVKNGCLLLRNEAELLKVKSGYASAELVKKNEIATIPGKKGEPKEISVRNLAQIIQARMEEILDMAMLEVKNSGLEKEIKKIVLTGGGAQLKQLDAMVQKHTGLAARIGYAVEYLSNGIDMEMRNPTNSTVIGLLLKGDEVLRCSLTEKEKKLTHAPAKENMQNAKKIKQ